MFWKSAVNLQENTHTEVSIKLLWNHTLHRCSPVNLLHIFRTYPLNLYMFCLINWNFEIDKSVLSRHYRCSWHILQAFTLAMLLTSCYIMLLTMKIFFYSVFLVCLFLTFLLRTKEGEEWGSTGGPYSIFQWGLFIQNVRKIFRKTNTSWYTHIRILQKCENFAYVLNAWPRTISKRSLTH